ncbi:MAG: phosphoribosyl-AMP cyclohydrolase [Blastochloris sp.]|nr:phosphoribosyl-AMP cyclohydrolase [Blastochloris sp.]
MSSTLTALLFIGLWPFGAAQAQSPASSVTITEAEVLKAQKAWGEALIGISDAFEKGGIKQAQAKAEAVLDAAYGYNLGPVLFKPTLSEVPQTFRTTREGALAYFVGQNPKFPGDSGFALKGWKQYGFENAAVSIHGDVAMTMGKVRLTNSKGEVTEVDKTWGFKKGQDGTLRIILHHSSLPYQKNK